MPMQNNDELKKQGIKDFTLLHKKHIIKESAISKTQVQPGAIVRFKYTGKDVHDKNPLVLVLNPKWKTHMHGVNINYLSDKQVNLLRDMVKETLTKKIAAKLKITKLPFGSADIGDPYKFYHTRLKKFIKKHGINIYRTYTLNEIKGIRVVDYRFSGMED